MDLRREKNFGVIGSVLVLVGGFAGVIPYVGVFTSAVSFIGEVLVLLALKGLGDKLGDDRPFRYYLYSLAVTIGVASVAIIMMLVGLISTPGFAEHPNLTNSAGVGLLATAVLLMLAAAIVGIYFTIKAWRATYELTGVEEFRKTADFLMWGVITLIVLVGIILLLVAMVYQIIAFSNLPEEFEPKSQEPEYDTGTFDF